MNCIPNKDLVVPLAAVIVTTHILCAQTKPQAPYIQKKSDFYFKKQISGQQVPLSSICQRVWGKQTSAY